jgi:hypothetical protein
LLCIDSSGFTETYKRFYFRDIQAFTVRQTNWWMIWGAIFSVPFVLFASISLANYSDPTVMWIFGIVAALFALALVLDVAAGPSCACYLHTAVQSEQLPSLNRVRRARKVMAHLRPLIAQAQGQLLPEEIPAHLRTWEMIGVPPAPAPAGIAAAALVSEDPTAPPRILS